MKNNYTVNSLKPFSNDDLSHKDLMKDALRAKYDAQYTEAQTNFWSYIENNVSVGEHPNLVHEAALLLEKMEHAESCLKLLDEVFDDIE